MEPEFSITTRTLLGTHIVELNGELDAATANGVADALVEVAGSTVVVDMSELTFLDSTGISAIVKARNRIQKEGRGDLVVSRPSRIVHQALEIVGLSSWIVAWSSDWDGWRSDGNE
jgi:anti-sigma B factor antagonist